MIRFRRCPLPNNSGHYLPEVYKLRQRSNDSPRTGEHGPAHEELIGKEGQAKPIDPHSNHLIGSLVITA
jgi:hypothetical protein